MEANPITKNYIKQHRKSQLAGFALTFFFGWFGLFYASVTGGLAFVCVSVALGLIYLLLFLWSILPYLWSLLPSWSSSFLPSLEDWLDSDEAIPEFLNAISLMSEYASWQALPILILINWAAGIALSAILISKHNKKVMALAELMSQPQMLLPPQVESQPPVESQRQA